MTPAARLAAAIEVLQTLESGRGHADDTLKAWGKAHRFAGSGDRRAISERVYGVLRARARIAWRMQADDARALVLGSLVEIDALAPEAIAALFTGEGHAPAPLTEAEAALVAATPLPAPETVQAGVPAFVVDALKQRFGDDWLAEAQALTGERAPVDLRVNSLRGDVEAARRLLSVDGLEPEATPFSTLGLRLPPARSTDVQATRAFQTGWIEVQDEASQIAAALSGAGPGMTVIDWCAGAGGKTLALAAQMNNTGKLLALDVDARRLTALGPRLTRSGAEAQMRTLHFAYANTGAPDDLPEADVVFVDAPCSGSGTWRRHPEGAHRLTLEAVQRLAALQLKILTAASQTVKAGGRLAYATCSVLPQENEEIAEAFLDAHQHFRRVSIAEAATSRRLTDAARERLSALAEPSHMLQMTPRRTGTDGFFIALFERTA